MMNTIADDSSAAPLIERDLWLVGAEWPRAVAHVIDRLHRVKVFSGTLSTDELLPFRRVHHDVDQLQQWGADGTVDWERELGRYINENMARSIRANVRMVRALRNRSKTETVTVATALPESAGLAILRHLGLTGDIHLSRIS